MNSKKQESIGATNNNTNQTITELKKEFVQLKSLYDFPRLYIISHFSDLRNEANLAFSSLNHSSRIENIKTKDLNWTKITERINEFKTECLDFLIDNKSFADIITTEQIDSFEKSLFEAIKSNKQESLQRVKELIYGYTFKLERIVFRNKTLIFIERSKSKHEHLFLKMNPCTTAGKLILVTNEYLGRRGLEMLKEKSGDKTLTADNLKFKLFINILNQNLTDRQIDEITTQDLVNLSEIDSSSCGFNSIDNYVFNNFKLLIEINLSHNHFDSMPNDIFSNLTELENIDISFNKLKSVDKNLFKGLKKVKNISLSNNHLCVIDPELFSELKELSIITLSHNKIVSIDKNFFKGLVKLSIIDMSHNRLEVIENDFLSGLVKLEMVNLAHNKIKSIPVNLFEGLFCIRNIDLSNNLVRVINRKYLNKYPVSW